MISRYYLNLIKFLITKHSILDKNILFFLEYKEKIRFFIVLKQPYFLDFLIIIYSKTKIETLIKLL